MSAANIRGEHRMSLSCQYWGNIHAKTNANGAFANVRNRCVYETRANSLYGMRTYTQ